MDPIPTLVPAHGEDGELDRVEAELLGLDPSGDRVARVIRDTLDQLYDGRHTGRWDFAQLHKTEKTHMGTLVEINLHREFNFGDGGATDYCIAGVDVDCKYSMRSGGWMLPPEVVDHLALIVTADDARSRWSAGLVRVRSDVLNRPNRDAKGTLSKAGRERIRWLWTSHHGLAPNLLLNLPAATRDAIMGAKGARGPGGKARLFELCRRVQGVKLRRTLVETVGWGLDDPLKRMRDNGGARDGLRPEGIVVLGHQRQDPAVAAALGLPVPNKGEFVSARLVPAFATRVDLSANIAGKLWVVARLDDPVVAAPVII